MLLELGGFFTAALAVEHGRIVDGIGGSAGGLGYRALGTLDGEVAYALGRVRKSTLFTGGAAFVAGAPDLPPEDLAARAVHDPRARVAWDALIEAAAKLVAALRVAAPGAREVLLSGPRGPGAGGRRRSRAAPRRGAARATHRRLHHARQGSGAGRGADRRRPRRRDAPGRGRGDAPPREPRLRARPPLRGGRGRGAAPTSGSRADPDRRVSRPAPSPSRPCAPGRRSSPSTTSATSIRSASARRIRCGSAGADTRPPRSSRSARGLSYDAVVYCGGLENHPDVVAELARDRVLLGNAPERAPAGCAIPRALFRYLAGRGFAVPDTRFAADPLPAPAGGSSSRRAAAAGRACAPGRASGPRRPRSSRSSSTGVSGVGLVRGRRPPERGPRLDRAAPRPAELPVRGQRHAARGRGGGARGSARRSRTP